MGSSYETYFDQLEVFWALLFANTREETTNIWGPPGRFAWKQQRGYGGGPLDQVTNEAQQAGAQWEPLRNGLFQGSEKRFTEIASEYRDLLARYPLR
ncbi:MAG: hypothetical protein ACXWKC_15150 [Xanthobacteraceae bacterium]